LDHGLHDGKRFPKLPAGKSRFLHGSEQISESLDTVRIKTFQRT
jgi:hypothetical protein